MILDDVGQLLGGEVFYLIWDDVGQLHGGEVFHILLNKILARIIKIDFYLSKWLEVIKHLLIYMMG